MCVAYSCVCKHFVIFCKQAFLALVHVCVHSVHVLMLYVSEALRRTSQADEDLWMKGMDWQR